MRMLYLRVSRESNKSNCLSAVTLATVGPDGPSPIHGGSPNFDAKEAHSLGMTRRFPLLLTCLSRCAGRSCLALLLLVLASLAAAPSARAQTAGTWNKRGQEAELREDYDAAYEDYLHAHQKNPKDMRYQARLDRMRFQAAAVHVDRGRVLRQSGDIGGALNQFTRALQIDPGNESATQEIRITQSADHGPAAAAGSPAAESVEAAAAIRDTADITAPIQLKPLSDDLITLSMVEDPKVVYEAIGKEAGLNVLFDPDFTPSNQTEKRIPVHLNSVTLSDALRIVGTLSNTFYKPVTSDTIFVAANTRDKHTNLDEMAVQTFYLTNLSQANDINDILNALRQVLTPDDKILAIPTQNAIVMRAPPSHLVLAEKLINDLDRTRAEVVVDVAILEVNRDKIRNLGITLPQSFGITPQASPNSTTSSSSTTTGATGSGSNPSSFTLNTLANTNATNFAVTISGGTVNALMSDADTRVLQNPSIRATDGQQATLKIGSKIPVATGSYSAGAATGITAGIGVQTQFTYLDVGVNIDMTPTIHLDREVSLKLNVEVSTQSGSVTISGVTEPIIGQRSEKATIQLKDGEPCMFADILTKEDNSTNSGTPGLSDIPLLKYFFGSIYKENDQDEVVFILIPHIVREAVLTGLNTRAIDTGTSGDIELRRSPVPLEDQAPEAAAQPPTTTTSAANAAGAMVQQMKQQAMPPTPPAAQTPATRPPAAQPVPSGPPVSFSILPTKSLQPIGGTFQVAIQMSDARDVSSIPLQLQFDPKVLALVNVDAGPMLSSDGQPAAVVHRDEGNGLVTIQASRPPGVKGVDGQGYVFLLTFKTVAAGDSNITLVRVGAKNSAQQTLPAVGSQATVKAE
jgi:general secretion pathway protein D